MTDIDLSHIAEDLHPLAQPVENYTVDPNNARLHDERSILSIVDSLTTFGQRKPIVVHKETMTTKAGSGTLTGALRMGWKHIAVVHVDEDNKISDAYALADNRTGELSEWDFEQLVDVLDDLQESKYPVDKLGWSQDEIDNLLKADWNPPTAGDDGGLPSADDAARSHVVKFSDAEHEILQRVISRMRATGALNTSCSDGFAVSTLAEYWAGRENNK